MADPNGKDFPIVSYVIDSPTEFDVENPLVPAAPAAEPHFELTEKMPHLKNLRLIAAMRRAVNDVVQSRSMLEKLGPRPDHEAVDAAKLRLAEIDANRSSDLVKLKKDAKIYKAVIALEDMHEAYERVLSEAERKLETIYDAAATGEEVSEEEESKHMAEEEAAAAAEEELDEEVNRVLREAELGKAIDRVDLSRREIKVFPEGFGKLMKSLVVLNFSKNRLQAIPNSIIVLENLEELNLSENLLESLPDSISFLFKLKILDVSGNQLAALPDSISHCRSLVQLNASFNNLTYLPTSIGFELINLKRLDIHLNKIRFLPTSIGGMKSLCFLDVHFNVLHGLPTSIGKLTNLEVLNLSGNFSDLTELPNALCDVISLKELDLSHNQIHALPDTFGQLVNLTKLNLDENPLVIPRKEVVAEGVEAVRTYMAKRWTEILMEDERQAMLQVRVQTEMNVFTRFLSSASSAISGYLGSKGKSNTDPYLDQLL